MQQKRPDDEAAEERPADVPMNEDPRERDRRAAMRVYPPEWIPEEGPIPAADNAEAVIEETVEVELPEWIVEALDWRLEHTLGRGTPREKWPEKRIRLYLEDLVEAEVEYVTPDGTDVIEAMRGGVDGEDRER